jgi:hypothetical protein
MNLAQVLLLALAAPVTYLLLYVLLRLENLLPDPAPPAAPAVPAARAVPAAARAVPAARAAPAPRAVPAAAAAQDRHAAAGPGPQSRTAATAPGPGRAAPATVTSRATVVSGARQSPAWVIPLPVPAAAGAPPRGSR